MRNILSVLFVFLFPLCGVSQTQPCNNYACKMELARKALQAGRYKSALDLARGAESYDASKKAEVNAFIDEVFVAIEGKRQEAERERKKAEEAERLAEASRKMAEAERQKSEVARIDAVRQQEIAEGLLDSLGKFSVREEALENFNNLKKKGDAFYANQQWDSADVCLRLALDIAGNNPFIQVGINEIIDQISVCATHFSNRKLNIEQASKGDSILGLGGMKNYFLSYTVYKGIDKKYIGDTNDKFLNIINAVNICLDSKDTTCSAPSHNLALRYFLLELYKQQNNKKKADSLFAELKKYPKREIRLIQKIYIDNTFVMNYPGLYNDLVGEKSIGFLAHVNDIDVSGFTVEGYWGYSLNSSVLSKKFRCSNGRIIGFRLGYVFLPDSYLFKGRGAVNFSYSMDLDYKNYSSKNSFADSIAYFNGSNFNVIPNVDKWTVTNSNRISIVGKCRITFPMSRYYKMSALSRLLRSRGFSAGFGLKYTYANDKFDKFLYSNLIDTTIIGNMPIYEPLKTTLSLPVDKVTFSAIGYEIDFLFSFANRSFSFNRSPLYGLINLGIRFEDDFYLFHSKKSSFYENLEKEYKIIAGKRLSVFECFLTLNF